MKYIEAIKDGFRLINKNWQLVLIQVGMVFMSSIGFFIIVGIPLAIAFIIFGIDLTALTETRDIFRMLRGPSDIISKYLGLILIVVASFILYILVVCSARHLSVWRLYRHHREVYRRQNPEV